MTGSSSQQRDAELALRLQINCAVGGLALVVGPQRCWPELLCSIKLQSLEPDAMFSRMKVHGQWEVADGPGTILTCYSDVIRKSGLPINCLGSKNKDYLFLEEKKTTKTPHTHVLLNFRGSFLCVFSSYRFDKRLKNSVLKTDSSKLSYSCSCRMKMSSCIVLKRNRSIHHSDKISSANTANIVMTLEYSWLIFKNIRKSKQL